MKSQVSGCWEMRSHGAPEEYLSIQVEMFDVDDLRLAGHGGVGELVRSMLWDTYRAFPLMRRAVLGGFEEDALRQG